MTTDALKAGRRGRSWPWPAFLVWLFSWCVYKALVAEGLPPGACFLLAWVPSVVAARWVDLHWRRGLVLAGFPLSWVLLGLMNGTQPWMAAGWLLPVVVLASLYPLRAWADAPLFPTPRGALDGLNRVAPLTEGTQIVDAGCGLGAGLLALARQYPQADLVGWEWSRMLALICGWRVTHARVKRADIWAQDWSRFDMVYLFQRPETMDRAGEKASNEMKPGSYLVSLEFEWIGARPVARLETVAGKPVWVYQAPFKWDLSGTQTDPADGIRTGRGRSGA